MGTPELTVLRRAESLELNPAAEWKERRNRILSCSFCRPNRDENTKRHSKQRAKGWKHRTKKRRQYE
jgi:hypothetical protein